MARPYLSNVDAAMLQLDEPTNPMVITTVMVFGSPIDYEHLKATLKVRLLDIARFRQRLAWSRGGIGRPYWEEDPGFDLGYHLQRARLGTAAPADQDVLQKAVGLLASTPLDMSRPLWQLHLIDGYGDGSVLVVRSHHAIADGVALVHVMLSLTDPEPDAAWPGPEPADPPRPGRSRLKAIQQGAGMLKHPSLLRSLGRMGLGATADMGRFLISEPDPDTALRGELGYNKRVAWSAGVPLEEIKTIGKALGGTVNDVMLSVVAGALRRYLKQRGESVEGIDLRVTVPVNVRPLGDGGKLGNRVGAMFVTLPVSIADPVCRLGEIVQHVNGRKNSLEAPVYFAALNVLGRAPAPITKGLVNTFGKKASVVMTNVKGPQEQLYLAGAPLTELIAWVPTTGGMALGLSVLSYAGEVRLGVLTDGGLMPDPGAIIAGFHAEFESLLGRASGSVDDTEA